MNEVLCLSGCEGKTGADGIRKCGYGGRGDELIEEESAGRGLVEKSCAGLTT